ncbi:MAG: restriction endonuclease subunit S [bacterium]|nr:restriction endonuclease subunit S [bacterium]
MTIPKSTIAEFCFVGDGAHAKIKRHTTGIMYLTSKNFKDQGLDLSKVDYISEEDFNKYFKDSSKALTKPNHGDIVFSIIGTIGVPFLTRVNDLFGLSSSVAILRPRNSNVLSKYLYYWIKGDVFQNALYGVKGGVAQGYVSLEMIKSLPFAVPTIEIQRKIAAVLSAYDDLIENNLRRIKILEQMAQTIYRGWFVHFRFPGYEKVKLIDSPLGKIPQGWEVKTFRELVEVQKGRKPKVLVDKSENGFVSYLLIDSMKGGQQQYTNPDKMVLAERDDVVMIMDGASSGIVTIGVSGAVGSTLARLRPFNKNEISPYLLFMLLKDKETEIRSKNVGAAIPHANKEYLNIMQIPVPTDKINKDFESQNSSIFQMILNLNNKNINLRRTRDLLLPKLISGELDVTTIDLTD